MTTSIRAIETEYAGCRFRSRLEARWALFFDQVTARWEYEPEGLDIDGVRYLPDFQLPDLVDIYVEVKGRMDAAGMRKVLALARSGHPVLVLGSIPRPDQLGPHFRFFHWHRGHLEVNWVSFVPCDPDGHITLIPFGWPLTAPEDETAAIDWGLHAVNVLDPGEWVLVSAKVSAAFGAARSARFERGPDGAE